MTGRRPTLEAVHCPVAPEPHGHYSQGVATAAGTIWISTQLPSGGGVDASSAVRQQVRQALANVVSIVEAAGGTVESIAKVTLYVTDIGAWETVDAVFADVFGAHRPARTVLQVAGLHHGYRVAADAVAYRVHQ